MWMWREHKRRRKLLDAVSATLRLNEEIGLEMDQLADAREALLARSTELLDLYGEEWPPEKDRTDIIDIGPECFASGDRLVISYQGANYYKACGQIVKELLGGGTTSCVRRTNHHGHIHEDYYGTTRESVAAGLGSQEAPLAEQSGG